MTHMPSMLPRSFGFSGLFLSLLILRSTVAQETYKLETAETAISECGPPDYFACGNGNCLPFSHICDGDDDCGDGSDETKEMCSSIKCSEKEIQCTSGRCISKDYRCDRQRHCRDGSDEEGCTYPPCPTGMFACANNTQCLAAEEVCDGTIDCKDGEATDERHPNPCPDNVTCPAPTFKCKGTNVCAMPNWLCDGENDCGDNSDEDPETCALRQCPNGWFRCSNNQCIPHSSVCNGVIDCKDGKASDERHPKPCPNNVTCPVEYFSCENTNICAHPHWMCDGSDDCGDNTDELEENCKARSCPEGWFRCGNHRCIPPNWRCDGGADCLDKSDEQECHVSTTTPSPSTPKRNKEAVNEKQSNNQRSTSRTSSQN